MTSLTGISPALKEKGPSTFVQDSAPASAEPECPTKTIEGDDQHKERFTDEDVGKPKQGG